MLITHGTLYLEEGPRQADLLIQGGIIRAVGDLQDRMEGEEVLDAAGLAVLPGMIDLHVHLNDSINGVPLADSFLTGSRAALREGVTTLVAFATRMPGTSLARTVEVYRARGDQGSFCDFHFHLTPTEWTGKDWEELEVLAGMGYRTLKLYTTYKEAGLFTDPAALRAIMKECAKRGLSILLHCEDSGVLEAAGRKHATTSAHSHALQRPEEAETRAIQEAVQSALATGARLHVVHVSTAEGAALLNQARARLSDPESITFETAPHYLLLNEECLKGEAGHRYLCTPPLRSERSRARLEALAAAGAIPVFATDHCAFTREDKDRFANHPEKVPRGIAGVGALAPLLYELLVKKHGMALGDWSARLSANPARVAGLYPRKGVIRPGSDADLVLLDPRGKARPITSTLADAHEPYPKETTTLDVRRVLLRGKTVVIDNALTNPDQPEGKACAIHE